MGNLVLIGARGAGKSKVSRQLSLLMRRPVMSTDLLVSYEYGGLDVPAILQQHGGDWRPFRETEYRIIQRLSQMDELIIDTGGGMVVDLDENGGEIQSQRKLEALRHNAYVVWLKGNIKQLVAKVAQDPRRPALADRQGTEALVRRREPWYEAAAHLVVKIDGKTRKSLAREIFGRAPGCDGPGDES
ncbi:MAG: shikimate kinase [Magnetococcus sp. WYHC-3]